MAPFRTAPSGSTRTAGCDPDKGKDRACPKARTRTDTKKDSKKDAMEPWEQTEPRSVGALRRGQNGRVRTFAFRPPRAAPVRAGGGCRGMPGGAGDGGGPPDPGGCQPAHGRTGCRPRRGGRPEREGRNSLDDAVSRRRGGRTTATLSRGLGVRAGNLVIDRAIARSRARCRWMGRRRRVWCASAIAWR